MQQTPKLNKTSERRIGLVWLILFYFIRSQFKKQRGCFAIINNVRRWRPMSEGEQLFKIAVVVIAVIAGITLSKSK